VLHGEKVYGSISVRGSTNQQVKHGFLTASGIFKIVWPSTDPSLWTYKAGSKTHGLTLGARDLGCGFLGPVSGSALIL